MEMKKDHGRGVIMDEYKFLESGSKIKEGDEYSTSPGQWRTVPSFLVGDLIPESSSKDSTIWRRTVKVKSTGKIPSKKNWFTSLFG